MSKIDREKVWLKCDKKCAYCGTEITMKQMQVDHKEPLFRNSSDKELEWYKRERGTNDIDNLLPSCPRCNRWKSTFTLESFRDIVQTSLDRLERDTPNFRLAKDYGLLTITEKKVIFYFER